MSLLSTAAVLRRVVISGSDERYRTSTDRRRDSDIQTRCWSSLIGHHSSVVRCQASSHADVHAGRSSSSLVSRRRVLLAKTVTAVGTSVRRDGRDLGRGTPFVQDDVEGERPVFLLRLQVKYPVSTVSKVPNYWYVLKSIHSVA